MPFPVAMQMPATVSSPNVRARHLWRHRDESLCLGDSLESQSHDRQQCYRVTDS